MALTEEAEKLADELGQTFGKLQALLTKAAIQCGTDPMDGPAMRLATAGLAVAMASQLKRWGEQLADETVEKLEESGA